MKDIIDVYELCVRLEDDASDEYDKHLKRWDEVQEDSERLSMKIAEMGEMSYCQGRIDAIRDIKRFIHSKDVKE